MRERKVGSQTEMPPMVNTIMAMPRAACYRGMVMSHMIHHRAQLGVYLRLNEIELPGMYGPSADEMKFWQEKAQSA